MFRTMMIAEFEQAQKRKDLNIIDVREIDEYISGHIPEAKNIPLSQLAERYTEMNKEKEYSIICHSGGRSEQASRFLAEKGYHVTNIMGGMSAWRGETADGM